MLFFCVKFWKTRANVFFRFFSNPTLKPHSGLTLGLFRRQFPRKTRDSQVGGWMDTHCPGFRAGGLGVWLLTCDAQPPKIYHPPTCKRLSHDLPAKKSVDSTRTWLFQSPGIPAFSEICHARHFGIYRNARHFPFATSTS